MTPIPSRSWRRLAALLAVLLASLPFLLAADRVDVAVDGEQATLHSYESTVADLLVDHGIEVGPDDVVHPAPSTDLRDGLTVRVQRAREVRLVVQGVPQTVSTTARRVGAVLDDAGLDLLAGAVVSPPRHAVLAPDQSVRVLVPLHVEVIVDDTTTTVAVPPGIVADALAAADVELGSDDDVVPSLDTRLVDGATVTISRIGVDEVVEEVELPFATEQVDTDELFVGESDVAVEGAPGLRRDVHRVDLVDGVEVARELVRSTTVREPVTRVVRSGTGERPAPPPPPPTPAPAPPPPPPPAPAPAPASSGSAADDATWDRLANCESGGRWSHDGTYDGGLQFHPDTWNRWKPAGYPEFAHQATREQQIATGRRLHAARGWSPWPSCARKLGLE